MAHTRKKSDKKKKGFHKYSRNGNEDKKWYVEKNGVKKEIKEVWESWNGDLYFIAEKEKNGDIFCYARLYGMPEFAEWGHNNLNYLKEQYGKNKFWKVKKENWENIDTYEKGLLKPEEKGEK